MTMLRSWFRRLPASVLLARIRSGDGTATAKESLRIEDVIHDLVLLLRTFAKPMERATLEFGIVLMQNDEARQAILDKTSTRGRAKSTGRTYIDGLDHLLGDLEQLQF